MHRWLVVLLALAPIAAADHQPTVWQDGSHGDLPQEGIDLLSLQMWEADLRDAGPGVMLRLIMQSGSQTGGLGTLHVNGTLLGTTDEVAIHLWSEDHRSWKSDQRIYFQSTAKSAPLPSMVPYPIDRWGHDVWVFIPLTDLGAKVGQRVDGFVFDAFAQSDDGWMRLDTAPGGYWLPGSESEAPEFGAEPGRNVLSLTAADPASVFLGGAGHHLNATGAWSQGILTMQIHNPHNDTDQVIDILAPAAARALGQVPTLVKANQTVTTVYQIERVGEAQLLRWDIRSDIGGVALLDLELDAIATSSDPPEPPVVVVELERKDPVVKPPAPQPQTQAPPVTATEPVKKDSPAGSLLAVLALGAVLLLRRR